MKKIFLNQKLINFFEKIREEIFNNGFSRYVIDTIAPTLRFFSFILKNINKIYFFLIKKLNLKKIIILSVFFLSIVFLILDFLSYRVDKIVKNLIIDQGNQALGQQVSVEKISHKK